MQLWHAAIFSVLQVVAVVLNPGDALVFHGETPHYTPPNVTDTRSVLS